jgi:hypothetical protein
VASARRIAVSALVAFGAYLIAQTFLGALPHQHFATWADIALTVLAISATTAGLYALIGTAGLALSAALMVFVGNPFSGATSAPDLLPDAVHHLGQWLPPGAGANLLRSSAYFGGNGAGGHLTVILLWVAFGLGAIAVGQHTSTRFAGHPERIPKSALPVPAPSEPKVENEAEHVRVEDNQSDPHRSFDLAARRLAGRNGQRPGAHEAG